MSTTTETYTQKAQAHIATARSLTDTMRMALLDTYNTPDGRVINEPRRRTTLAALQRRGLVSQERTYTSLGLRHTLTDKGLFVWAAASRPADLLELAAKKDAEAEAAQAELEARSCRDCAEEVGADQIARNGGYCDGCADNQDAIQRAEQDAPAVTGVASTDDNGVTYADGTRLAMHAEPIGFDHFTRGSAVVCRADGATGRVESRYSDGRLAVVLDHTGRVHVDSWHMFTLLAVDPAQPAQIAPAAQELEATEEMADTGPQGRDWPKLDRSSVATVTSILSANRLPGWCNASAQFVGYPPRAVLVHVPAGEDGTRYVQPLADALPYRNARVEFQPKPGSNLGGIVVVHPLHLEEAPCPSS